MALPVTYITFLEKMRRFIFPYKGGLTFPLRVQDKRLVDFLKPDLEGMDNDEAVLNIVLEQWNLITLQYVAVKLCVPMWPCLEKNALFLKR